MNRKPTSLQSLAYPRIPQRSTPTKSHSEDNDEMENLQNYDHVDSDKKSETNKTVIITDPLREKLLTGTYSTDDALDILENLGTGISNDNATRMAKANTDNLSNLRSPDLSRLETDELRGRAVLDMTINAILLGGESVDAIVKSCYDVNEYLRNVQVKRSGKEDIIDVYKRATEVILEPSWLIYEMRMKKDIREQMILSEDKYRRQFNERERASSTTSVSTTAETPPHSASDPTTPAPRVVLDRLGRSVSPSGTPTVSVFSSSVERLAHVKHMELYEKEKRAEWEEKFLEDHTRYEEVTYSNKQTAKDIETNELGLKRLQTTENLVMNLNTQLNIIVQKIKSAVQPYSSMVKRLSVNSVSVNDMIVVRPYDHDNLSGIYHLLLKEYGNANLNYFCTHLLRILSLNSTVQETENNPYAVAQRLDVMIKSWFDMRLDTFMTPDHLLTVALLKALAPDTEVRKESIQHTLEYAQRLDREADLKERPCLYVGMPLLSELVDSLKLRSDVTNEVVWAGTKSKQKPNPHPNTTSTDHMLERAALADEPSPVVPKDIVYRGPVTRDTNAWIITGKYNGRHPYTATPTQCSSCRHKPACFPYQCAKCSMWGHNKSECRQHTPNKPGGGAGQS